MDAENAGLAIIVVLSHPCCDSPRARRLVRQLLHNMSHSHSHRPPPKAPGPVVSRVYAVDVEREATEVWLVKVPVRQGGVWTGAIFRSRVAVTRVARHHASCLLA